MLNTGTVTLTGSINTGHSVSFTLSVISDHGLRDDIEYYIMNYSSGYYMSLAQESNVNSLNVITKSSKSSTASLWRTDKQNGLQYQLISVYSSTNKVLDIYGTNVDIYTNLGQPYQKFNIIRIDSGIHKGCYYIRYGNYYVAENGSHNVYITSTPSASAVWSFSAFEKGYADMFGFNYQEKDNTLFDTTGAETQFLHKMNALNYTATAWTNDSQINAYNRLQNTDFFVFSGHGSPGSIYYYDDNGNHSGRIVAHTDLSTTVTNRFISNLGNNALYSLRCGLLLGCNTGNNEISSNGNVYNLVDAIYEKGAHFVMGATEIMYIDTDNAFLYWFLDGINQGKNIEAAYEHVHDNVTSFYVGVKKNQQDTVRIPLNTYPVYLAGDKLQCLK